MALLRSRPRRQTLDKQERARRQAKALREDFRPIDLSLFRLEVESVLIAGRIKLASHFARQRNPLSVIWRIIRLPLRDNRRSREADQDGIGFSACGFESIFEGIHVAALERWSVAASERRTLRDCRALILQLAGWQFDLHLQLLQSVAVDFQRSMTVPGQGKLRLR